MKHYALAAALTIVLTLNLITLTPPPVVQAGTTTWSGSLGTGDASWDRAEGCMNLAGSVVWYDVQPFWVDITGFYNLEVINSTGLDTYYALYHTSFDSGLPSVNCISTNDDYDGPDSGLIGVMLTAGVQYYLVTTQFGTSAEGGEYTNQITGPGTITLDENPTVEPPTPPGPAAPRTTCIDRLPLDGAVVGTLTSTTYLYWAPGNLTFPAIRIPTGKSFWVLGIDEDGAYYKIIIQCRSVWVPVGVIGPTHDSVWNGTPLPTTVVH